MYNTIINYYYYISPEDADKDEDGDVIMTDFIPENNVIDGDTTSVDTNNDEDDNEDDEDEED